MLQTIIQTVIVTMGAATITSATPQELPQTPIQVKDANVHIVQEGESLSEIAKVSYNNKDAWTTILADNPQIKNPNAIEEGTELKVRLTPPTAEEMVKHATFSAKMVESVAVELKTDSVVVVEQSGKSADAVYVGGPLNEAQLTYLGTCEAGMDPAKNTGNGYYGAFQFSYGTWKAMDTGYERADLAPLEVQKAAVQKLLSRSSIFTQFPGCAKKMRSLGII